MTSTHEFWRWHKSYSHNSWYIFNKKYYWWRNMSNMFSSTFITENVFTSFCIQTIFLLTIKFFYHFLDKRNWRIYPKTRFWNKIDCIFLVNNFYFWPPYIWRHFFLYHRYCKCTCNTVNQFNFQNLIVLKCGFCHWKIWQ